MPEKKSSNQPPKDTRPNASEEEVSRSAEHLRTAAIEVIHAMQALLTDAVDYLESAPKRTKRLRRVRVQ